MICVKIYRKFEGKLTAAYSFSEDLYTVAIKTLSYLSSWIYKTKTSNVMDETLGLIDLK